MDQMHLSSFRMSTGPSSFFSEEIRFPFERQIEFCKAESAANNCGCMEIFIFCDIERSFFICNIWCNGGHVKLVKETCQGNNRSKYVSSPPIEKLHPMTGIPFDCLEFPKAYVFKDHKNKISTEHHDRDFFSSSLSDIFNSKVSLSPNNIPSVHSVDTTNYNFRDDGPSELLEAIEAQTIGNFLPDNDDLFSGVIDDVQYIVRPNFGDDTEDDLFYSGGGLEMKADDTFISNQPSEFFGEGASNGQPRRLCSSFAGEHPSRALFVRNINSNIEDWELRDLFEQFGDIHVLYTACKHHGFVVISYFDIRAAQNAMRTLQNKPFGHQQLDIHFSVPKEIPLDKDINHGALVVFELDSSVSNEDLLQIFGAHGDIKEIREIPHDHHRKYVEFYDVRAAEIAIHMLNKCDIAGKKTKLEPSRPGGGKQCTLMQHLSPELDQEESNERSLRNPAYDTSEFFGTNIYSGLADAATRGFNLGFNSTIQAPFGTSIPGVSSSVPYNLSSLMRSATLANHDDKFGLGDFSHALGHINLDYQRTQNFHPHSLPEYQSGVNNGILFNSPSPIMEMDINSRPSDGMISRHIHHTVGSGGLGNRSFEHQESAFGVAGNRTCPLHAHQYVWNGSGTYHHRHHNHQRYPPGAMMRQSPPSFITGIPHQPRPQMHGLPRPESHLKNTVLPLHHRHADSVENMGFPASSPLYALELASRNIFPCPGGNCIDPSFSYRGIPTPKQKSHMVHAWNGMPGPYEHPPNDRVRSRRRVGSGNQVDSKKTI